MVTPKPVYYRNRPIVVRPLFCLVNKSRKVCSGDGGRRPDEGWLISFGSSPPHPILLPEGRRDSLPAFSRSQKRKSRVVGPSPTRCGPVSRPAHVRRKGQSVSRESPPWHGREDRATTPVNFSRRIGGAFQTPDPFLAIYDSKQTLDPMQQTRFPPSEINLTFLTSPCTKTCIFGTTTDESRPRGLRLPATCSVFSPHRLQRTEANHDYSPTWIPSDCDIRDVGQPATRHSPNNRRNRPARS